MAYSRSLLQEYPNKKACCLLRAFSVQLRATSCQILGTLCQRSCQPRHELKSSCQIVQNIGAKCHASQGTNSNHSANLSCSCQFLQNFWHFVQNVRASKAEPSSSTLKSVHKYNFIAEKAKLS